MSKALHKQALFYSIINYIGTVIGVVSVFFIYPGNLKFLGTIRYIDNISQIFYPIMVLGASHALIRFYPALDEKRRNMLFNYSMASIVVISICILILLLLFDLAVNFDDIAMFYFAFPISVSLAFIDLFRKQSQDLQKLAVPTLYEKIIPKIVLPLLFILLFKHFLNEFQSIFLYMVCYLLVFVLTSIYLFKYFKPGYNYKFKTLFVEISRSDYFRYSLYAFAGSFGSLLAFRIDGIVIYNLISEEANGIFNIGVTLSSTLQIPAIGMFALYAPIISDYLKNDSLDLLNLKYKEVARVLFLIGALLYSCIFLGVKDLFLMLPMHDKLMQAVPIILILGFNVVINMATGFSTEIITYSKYYKFNMIAILGLMVINIPLNLFVVYCTRWGLDGIAWASFLSMVLFNLLKLVFIYKKFRLLPFDKGFGIMAIIFTASTAIIYFLPDIDSHFVNMVYKTGLSLAINIIALYRLKLVFQMNMWIDKGLKILKLKF